MGNEEIKEYNQFEKLIQELIDNEFSCSDDFFQPETIEGLRMNIEHLKASRLMKQAGIGNHNNFQTNILIRGDKVNWIEENSTNPFEEVYLRKIWRFINHMNKTCFTSIKSFESHYASYEIGSCYKRHIDQFKTEKGRKFSMVLYLNQDWKEKDEGALSIYPLKSEQKDILPVGGRIVFFRSDEMEHEVRPSFTRERTSIAGWLKN
jgi:SM-20-related protein